MTTPSGKLPDTGRARIDAELLRSVPVFDGVATPALVELAAAIRTRTLSPGEWVSPIGDTSRCLGFIVDGSLDVFMARNDSTPPVDTIGRQRSYGTWTLLGGGTRSGELRSSTDDPTTVVAELDGAEFDVIAGRHDDLREAILGNAIAELRSLELANAIRTGWGITDPDAVESLKNSSVIRDIAAGETLIRKGDAATSAYLILSGSFRVATETGALAPLLESAAPMLGPGQLVGERALLESGIRSATLVAMRASRVAEFQSGTFQAMCLTHPEVLLRTVGGFMRRHDSSMRPEPSKGHRIAIVGDGTTDVMAFAKRLADAFPNRATLIGANDVATAVGLTDDLSDISADLNIRRLAVWLDRRTEESPWLILAADPRDQRWTAACLSHGDHVVALVEKSGTLPLRHPVWPTGVAALQPTTLVILHPPSTKIPSDTARILQHLPANAHLHVRADNDADIKRVARTMAGIPYSLVLSGGGARGFAHLGALRAMSELGIPCDMIGGTSIGAVMAMYQGLGMPIDEQLTQTEVGFKGLMDYTLPIVSLLKGQRTSERIQQTVGDHTIEDLWVPYFCVSTNLTTNNMKIHESGSVATAVRASLALPGIFPPVHDGEHFLVDGGVLNNFPLDVMRARNPFGKVIAIDVAANMLLAAHGNFGLQLSGWRAAAAILRRKPLAPNITTTLVRTSVIGSARDRERYLREHYADLHMELSLKECSLLDFGAVRSVAEFGYQAARPKLATWWDQEQRSAHNVTE